MTEEITIDSKSSVVDAQRIIAELQQEHGYVSLKVTTGKQRTPKQNSSLHLWCGWVAKGLNDAGLDKKAVFAIKNLFVPWSGDAVKEDLWKPIQKAMFDIESTTEADRADYGRIEKVLTRHLAENLGYTTPEWPKKKIEEQEK